MKKYRQLIKPIAIFILYMLSVDIALADNNGYEEFKQSSAYGVFALNNLWLLVSTALVLLMHLGFSSLEAGLCQKKNTVNILFKNVFIICMGILTYYLVGFNWHYPSDWLINNFVGTTKPAGFETTEFLANNSTTYGDYTYWSDFIFQAVFAATAASIVSGAVAERAKLSSYLIFTTILVALLYPIVGSWHWGGGFLSSLPTGAFYDFAGSTVVHLFGGAAALAYVMVLGPRKGKYTKQGIRPILGHSMPLATIGVFLLFLGWFGFNGGSVLSADPALISYVFVTTALAASAGAIGSILCSTILLKKPDLSMALNGILAGLVGITAGADAISVPLSILTGFVAGVIVVLAILSIDRIKIDDPVGAISVHGVCGVWGTLAVALFSQAATFTSQVIGILVVTLVVFFISFGIAIVLKLTIGIRVESSDEFDGLDLSEHGAPAYVLE